MALMPLSEIKCPIDITEFPQYTGFDQYQQIVAIEVPVVYDQCLAKKCLLDVNDPRIQGRDPICPENSYTAVAGLNAVFNNISASTPVNFREFRDFTITINNVSSTKISATKKSVTVNYGISFIAEVFIGTTSTPTTINLTNLTETVVLNYPDNASEISVSTNGTTTSLTEPIFKIVMLPDMINCGAYFTYKPSSGGSGKVDVKAYFNICYGLMIKSELESQVLVPFYGFFNTGKTCTGTTTTCPCVQCLNTPPGPFYPPIDFSVFDCVTAAPAARDANATLVTPVQE